MTEAKVRLQIGQDVGFSSWNSNSLIVGVRTPVGVETVLLRWDGVDSGVKTVAGVKITISSSESSS